MKSKSYAVCKKTVYIFIKKTKLNQKTFTLFYIHKIIHRSKVIYYCGIHYKK